MPPSACIGIRLVSVLVISNDRAILSIVAIHVPQMDDINPVQLLLPVIPMMHSISIPHSQMNHEEGYGGSGELRIAMDDNCNDGRNHSNRSIWLL